MLPFEDRFTRQRQLPDVGIAGQQRISAARVDAHDRVESEYLRRAGVGGVEMLPSGAPAFADADVFANPEARAFAASASRALNTVRALLANNG